MRWSDGKTWQVMVEWATRLHDGIYASQSPMPAPRLVGCTNPEEQCVKLAIAAKTADGQWFCTKPSFLPALCAVPDCPSRIYDWKEGQGAQSTKKEAKMPTLRAGSTSEILAWTEATLRSITHNAGNPAVRIAAEMMLEDLDEHPPVSLATLEALGEAMLDRLLVERPWKKLA